VDKLAIQDGRAMCVWREQVYQDDDLHLIVEREPPSKEEVCEGLESSEEGEDNPVHHPLHILFDVLGPDCLVAGVGGIEGSQAQGDHSGQQVRDHCKVSGSGQHYRTHKRPLSSEAGGSLKKCYQA